MAHHTRNRKEAYNIAEDVTKAIAHETGDRVSFITEENGWGIVLATDIGEHGIYADIHIGQQVPLHASAVGKAILAELSQTRVDEILDRHGLPQLTENTITERSTLFEELDEIQERGYAINHAERVDGLKAVAVAVTDLNDTVLGGFSVSGPIRRMSTERIHDEVSETVLSMAEEFELRSRYSESR